MQKIAPIFKQGDKQVITNWRPIAILPHLGKNMEKAMCKRLSDYYYKKSTCIDFNFISGMDILRTLINMQYFITKAIDTEQYSVFLVLVDYNIYWINLRAMGSEVGLHPRYSLKVTCTILILRT